MISHKNLKKTCAKAQRQPTQLHPQLINPDLNSLDHNPNLNSLNPNPDLNHNLSPLPTQFQPQSRPQSTKPHILPTQAHPLPTQSQPHSRLQPTKSHHLPTQSRPQSTKSHPLPTEYHPLPTQSQLQSRLQTTKSHPLHTQSRPQSTKSHPLPIEYHPLPTQSQPQSRPQTTQPHHLPRSILTQIMVNETASSSSHVSGDTIGTRIPILPEGDGKRKEGKIHPSCEFYFRTHRKRDQNWVGVHAETAYERFEQKKIEIYHDSTFVPREDEADSQPTMEMPSDMDIWVDSVGKKEGRIFGLGSVSKMLISSSNQPNVANSEEMLALRSQMHALNASLQRQEEEKLHMKQQMQRQEQKMMETNKKLSFLMHHLGFVGSSSHAPNNEDEDANF